MSRWPAVPSPLPNVHLCATLFVMDPALCLGGLLCHRPCLKSTRARLCLSRIQPCSSPRAELLHSIKRKNRFIPQNLPEAISGDNLFFSSLESVDYSFPFWFFSHSSLRHLALPGDIALCISICFSSCPWGIPLIREKAHYLFTFFVS